MAQTHLVSYRVEDLHFLRNRNFEGLSPGFRSGLAVAVASDFGALPVLYENFNCQTGMFGVGAGIDRSPVVDTKIDGS